MAENMTDFHILLPSNSSMKVFPLNTPDHFRTKLARPITLNGEWECCLSEATIPGKYFTVQPGYNDFYSIQQEIDVETETLLPKFDILSTTMIMQILQIKIDLKRGWDWIITPAKGNQLLNLLRVDPNKDFLITHKQQGFSVIRNYITPNKEIFKNQETKLIARESILDHTYEIKFEGGDLLQRINSKLLDVGLNDVKFLESNGQIIVTLPFNVNIEFKRDSCPKLMTALNIIDDAYVIRGEQLKIQFLYTRPASSIKDESFNVITYKVFPTTRKETKSETFFIPSGMYHQAKDLFKEFKFIFLQLTADSRVRLHVPQNILVTFGERLKDLLGFVQRTFTHGDYKSEYPLELRAGKRLLTSGRNIVEEVSQGKSFRNAARDQLRQSGREITTDILRKLKGGGIRKVASISDSNTIEFLITGLGDAYFDLTHTYLNVQAKILKSDGSAFTPNDKCGPINYLLNTMFSECHISLNDRQISSESNYAYKAYIQSTLFHSESSQKNFLRAGLFYKDTVEEFDDTDLTATGKNLGF
ncbi:uncharacterized protein TNCV_156571 [Trichonephila clavipes]|nr:uncharacterized protein TNCV_156571 [Trichonephila clavipes]